MALLTLQYTADKPPEFAIILAFLAGCVELAMGILKLGESRHAIDAICYNREYIVLPHFFPRSARNWLFFLSLLLRIRKQFE